MSWTQKPLEDVADFCLGKMLDENKNKGELMPYLANINVRWGIFELDDLRQMRFEEREFDRFGLKSGDIMMCEGGEPGRCAIWQDQVPGMMFQKALHRIRPHLCIDSRFLFYLFLKMGRNNEFSGLFTGSTIKHLPKDKLAKVVVAFPKLEVQRRIAETLSAYDDLIENNRRRIALLEQAARLLYEEWFVRFRFPGYEHTKFINGLPVGWKSGKLHEFCSAVDYGYTASAEPEGEGPKFLRITDIVPDQIDWSEVPHCSISDERFKKFRLDVGDIVIARTGATVGFAKRLDKQLPQAVFASYLVRVRVMPEVDDMIVGIFVESKAYKDYVRSCIGGAAQPNANAKVLTSVPVSIPSRAIQLAFRESVEPMIDLKGILQFQNSRLRAARDLLLPKLMSGEVEV